MSDIKNIDYSDMIRKYNEGFSTNKSAFVREYRREKGFDIASKQLENLRRLFSKKYLKDRDQNTPNMDDSKVVPAMVDGKLLTIEEYCDKYSLPFEDVKEYKLVTHSGSGAYYNIRFKSDSINNDQEVFLSRLVEEISNIPNKPTSFKRDISLTEEHMLVIDVADLHIGKYSSAYEVGESDSYNVDKALTRALEGVNGILEYSTGWKKDKIVFVVGNDILHTDNTKSTTTSGTVQDTQAMWYENFLLAKELYIHIIDRLLVEADVHVMFNPSNHDYVSGFMLIQVIEAYFKGCENVTFDSSIAHRKYITYGNNLIGTTHGDGGKLDALPMTMANECKDWSNCVKRYMYVHHFHHKISKDYPGVTIEAVRTPSGTDSWHHRNQYQGSKKAIEGFIHHKTKGQIARLTYGF